MSKTNKFLKWLKALFIVLLIILAIVFFYYFFIVALTMAEAIMAAVAAISKYWVAFLIVGTAATGVIKPRLTSDVIRDLGSHAKRLRDSSMKYLLLGGVILMLLNKGRSMDNKVNYNSTGDTPSMSDDGVLDYA